MKKFERRIGARRTEGGSLGYVTILTIPKEVPSVPSEGPSRSTGRLSAALVAMGPARRQCSDHFGPCSRRAPSQMGFGKPSASLRCGRFIPDAGLPFWGPLPRKTVYPCHLLIPRFVIHESNPDVRPGIHPRTDASVRADGMIFRLEIDQAA
jgi:hypothetical protein